MKTIHRRLLLGIAAVSFLGLAPAIALYSVGYRMQPNIFSPQSIGVLFVETKPSDAEVTVASLKPKNSPATIGDLPAGPTQVFVSLDGYTSWQKTLDIAGNQATEARNIILFPEEATTQALASNARSMAMSPNRELIAVSDTNNRINIIDITGESLTRTQALPTEPQEMQWSPDSQNLLIKIGTGNYWIMNVASTGIATRTPLLSGAQTAIWDPRLARRILYQDRQHNIRAYNTLTHSNVVLIPQVSHFAITGRDIIVQHRRQQSVHTYSLQGNHKGETKNSIEAEFILKSIHATPGGSVAYIDAQNRVWYSETPSTPPKFISDRALNLAWSPDEKILLIQPDKFSIQTFNAKDKTFPLPVGQVSLISRFSREIVKPQWFAGGRHVIYHLDDEIWISEIDIRDHPIAWKAAATNTGDAQVAVGRDGEAIFYLHQDPSSYNYKIVRQELVIPNP